jgi:cytochrome c-type biogenesis protein
MLASLAVVSQETLKGPLLGPVGFIVAFFIGTVSFFSPCILPLVPGYLSFVSELSGEDLAKGSRRRVMVGTGLFVLGFATVFSALGATASTLGIFLNAHAWAVNRVAGAIVILMGIVYLVPSLIEFLERERRPFMRFAKPGVAGAFPLGVAFAAGWSPCVGPGLGVMYSLGSTATVGRATLLLFFFSLGFGVWFILAALGMQRALGASSWLRTHARILQVVGGVFMLAIGILLVTNQWDVLIAPLRRLIVNFAPPV